MPHDWPSTSCSYSLQQLRILPQGVCYAWRTCIDDATQLHSAQQFLVVVGRCEFCYDLQLCLATLPQPATTGLWDPGALKNDWPTHGLMLLPDWLRDQIELGCVVGMFTYIHTTVLTDLDYN